MKKMLFISFFSALMCLSCDLFGTLTGKDPVQEVIRNNPLDPYSLSPIEIDSDLTNGTIVPTVLPYFHFKYPEGVTEYSLQVCATDSFSEPLSFSAMGIRTELYRINSALENKRTYYWRIRPTYKDGLNGSWSSAHTFVVRLGVPVQQSPAADGQVDTPLPLFSWTGLSGIDLYEVSVSSSSDFSSDVVTKTGTGSSLKWSEGFSDNCSYYWRIRSVDFGVFGDWSESRGFSISLTPCYPDFPIEGGEYSDPRPNFGWHVGDVRKTTNTIDFQIELAISSEFQNGVIYETNTNISRVSDYYYRLADDLSPNTVYYWRVRAKYGEASYGPWSLVSNFLKNRVKKIIRREIGLPEYLKILIGTENTLYCYDSQGPLSAVNPNGTLLWSQHDFGFYYASVDSTSNVIASNGRDAYITKYLVNGSRGWSLSSATDVSQPCSMPALNIDGDLCIIRYQDKKLLAISTTGIEKWCQQLNAGVTVPPTIGSNGFIYVYDNGKIISLNSLGEKQWERSLSTTIYAASPISIGSDGSVLFAYINDINAGGKGRLLAISAEGIIKWQKEFDTSAGSEPLVGSDGTIYIAVGSRYYAISSDNGTEKWCINLNANCNGSGVVGNDGTIYITAQKVIAINSTDGSEKWRTSIGYLYSDSSLSMSADGTLFLGSSGNIYVIPTSSTGLAHSAWPTNRHDSRRTGCAGTPIP